MQEKILLIDDDENLRKVTGFNLQAGGFDVIQAGTGEEGLRLLDEKVPDLVITDVRLTDMDGLTLLEGVKERFPELPVIVITAYGTIEMAVKAMNRGAFNFIAKPFDRDTLRQSARKAIEHKKLKSDNLILSREIGRITGAAGMETANSAVKELLDTAIRAADSDASILITGESGTGKEVLARLIHMNSRRKTRPMLSVNCAAVPDTLIESEFFGHVKGAFTGAVAARKGRFAAASGGTLFLDEISELKIEMQAKLLRALQEQEITPVGSEKTVRTDVRIIAAANRDLAEEILAGRFREDLFYRLGVIPLHLPPLRERPEDIPALVRHFMTSLDLPRDVAFSEEAIGEMKKHRWPGNIRELKNTVERCVILRKTPVIGKEDLKLLSFDRGAGGVQVPEIPDEGISLEAFEKSLIVKALEKAKGNRSLAARLLKIPRHVLLYRLEKFKL